MSRFDYPNLCFAIHILLNKLNFLNKSNLYNSNLNKSNLYNSLLLGLCCSGSFYKFY